MVALIKSYLAFLAFYTFNRLYCQIWSLLEGVRDVVGSYNSKKCIRTIYN